MKRMKGLWLLILIIIFAASLPNLAGLTILNVDRPNQTKVGEDPGGAMGIAGLDDGEEGAEGIDEAYYLGEIKNNFNFPVELEIAVEVELLEMDYEGAEEPQWQNINIFFKDDEEVVTAEFNFADQNFQDNEVITANRFQMEPGEVHEITIDEESFIHLEEGTTLENFLGVARFYFKGYIPDIPEKEDYIFKIYPSEDLRKQYFNN